MPGASFSGNMVVCKETVTKSKVSDLKMPGCANFKKDNTLQQKSEYAISRGNGFPKSETERMPRLLATSVHSGKGSH